MDKIISKILFELNNFKIFLYINIIMKITKHISFFYIQSRIQYINKIIDETNKYDYITDIYIHTNKNDLDINNFNKYTNGIIKIVYHDLSNIDPYKLTWLCRELLYQQKDDYDIFMYIEDDMLIPNNAINYWIKYNERLIEKGYNLGFIRIETNNNEEYITDLYGEQFDTIICVDDITYCVNNKNPYCAFWIYNKKEFNKFVSSKYWDISNITGYETREQSAIGLHGTGTNWYKSTLIPIHNNKLIESCKIYHMPNNYVTNNSKFATILFNNAINKNIFKNNNINNYSFDYNNIIKYILCFIIIFYLIKIYGNNLNSNKNIIYISLLIIVFIIIFDLFINFFISKNKIESFTNNEFTNENKEITDIHSKLQIKYGNFNEELPEQMMVFKYLKGNEKVLEIGGNIGRNSLIIASILKNNNNNFVSLESDINIANQLTENRDLNNFNFHIESSALSNRKLIQRGWDTKPSEILEEGYSWVKTIRLQELKDKYNIEFDTLILDCEGAFYYILMDMPEILNNIKLIIMENDYHDISHKNYIDDILIKNNFSVDYVESGGWGPCYNNFFEVWKKS